MTRVILLTALLVLACPATGCVSSQFGQPSRDSGKAKVYPLGREAALRMCLRVFRSTGADKVAYQRKEDRVHAEYWPEREGYGTFASAWVEPEPDGRSRVHVSTSNRYALQFKAPIDEDTFHERFTSMLRRLRQEKAEEMRKAGKKVETR